MTLDALSALPGSDSSPPVSTILRSASSRSKRLVSIGASRLRAVGIDVPEPVTSPEHRLYELLRREHGDGAHSRYNALVRRLVSFERAAECAS